MMMIEIKSIDFKSDNTKILAITIMRVQTTKMFIVITKNISTSEQDEICKCK